MYGLVFSTPIRELLLPVKMSARNFEKIVMKENADKLTLGLRQVKDSICRKLCSKGLISNEIRQAEGKPGIDSILSALQDRVENDSRAYYEFLKILENDPALTYLKVLLEEDRLSKVSQANSTKSALIATPHSMFEETAQQRRILGSPALAPQGPTCANNQFKENPSLSPEEDLPLPGYSCSQTKQATATTTSLVSSPIPSTASTIRNDVAHSNVATSANTDTALDTCDEGNKTVEENTGKLSAEYGPVRRTRSNSDDSYYSAKNDCNSTEACSTTSSEEKHNESNSCSRCASLQVELESLKNKCDELQEDNHNKDREIRALTEQCRVLRRDLEIEETEKKGEREDKIGERKEKRKYIDLLSKEQDSKEKEKADKESERTKKRNLELEMADLKRFTKEDHHQTTKEPHAPIQVISQDKGALSTSVSQ